MKTLIAACIFFCMTSISMAAEQAAVVYDRSVVTEDITWRGSILVKGFVVVAPQATLRIEPGTVVRFAAPSAQQRSNLVIQGRLHAVGTLDQPITFTTAVSRPVRGSWGGIAFLTTEKRNLLEHCTITYAGTGIDVRFSTVILKQVAIAHAQTALMAYDGVVTMSGSNISDSVTGIELYTSELETKDSVITSCQRGCVLNKSAIVLASTTIADNQHIGFDAEDCRIKITGGEFSRNARGARIKGGEGQIFMTRFQKNSQTALHTSGTSIKILRCQFAENSQEAVRTEDGRALFLNNAFGLTGGRNLYNAGREGVSARQNWWGTADPAVISQKIHDVADDANTGAVHVYPWLNEKPALMP